MAMGSARTANTKQCSHVTLCFTTTYLATEIPISILVKDKDGKATCLELGK